MARKRTGLVRYIGNVVDDTKDFVDDVLDRGREIEHDVRQTVRRAVEEREDEDERDDRGDTVSRQLTDLREQVAELASRLAALTTGDGGASRERDTGDRQSIGG
jgi:Ran GTPase-activating protein (RanGAP) involved in mRNA processing and transport